MLLKLLYGNHEVPLDFPESSVKQVLEGLPMPVPESETQVAKDALLHPIDSEPLSRLVKAGDSVCIIISDMTRAWVRHHVFLPLILEELNKAGVPDDNILIISATGDHRKQTPEEHQTLVGEEVYRRIRVIDHQARDRENLVYMGTTGRGTPVWINRHVAGADRVILTGGIVYHFLAGWGGGKKAVIPGVAGYETIMKNHSLAFQQDGQGLDPDVCAGRLAGNPCAEDMVEGAGMVKPAFLVNSVINEEANKIAHVVAGNYISAFEAGCRFVDRHLRVAIDEPAELAIVSCGGYPKDINFYQTYKTLYNARRALKKGGTLVLLSESREGLGNPDFAAMFSGFRDNNEREAALRKTYTIGGHMGYHTTVISEELDVLVMTELPEEEVRAMGMRKISSPEEALEFIRRKHGGIPPAYIIPHGGSTLPHLKNCP